jgi:hypothetical protein
VQDAQVHGGLSSSMCCGKGVSSLYTWHTGPALQGSKRGVIKGDALLSLKPKDTVAPVTPSTPTVKGSPLGVIKKSSL